VTGRPYAASWLVWVSFFFLFLFLFSQPQISFPFIFPVIVGLRRSSVGNSLFLTSPSSDCFPVYEIDHSGNNIFPPVLLMLI
jgi:hypothetical protein